MRISSFCLTEAERWGEDLEVLLSEVGLSVEPSSALERICLSPTEILDYTPGAGISSAETYRQYLDASALAELANRLLRARRHPSFETLIPHLKLLNEGDPRQAGVASQTDQASRKIFELFSALLVMDFSLHVELEDHVHGSDGNPDVAFEHDGRRWGIACKVPTSPHHESLIRNLTRAVEQITESGVDRGFPLFNLKNVVSPQAFWRTDPSDLCGERFIFFPRPEVLAEQAIAAAHKVWREVQDQIGEEHFAKALQSAGCVPLVLSYLQVLGPVFHGDTAAATTSRFVACFHIDRHEPSDEAAIQLIHNAAREEWTS
jgi:hypothetical protein